MDIITIKNGKVGERSNPPDLRVNRLRAILRARLKTLLNRETSGPEETIAGSNPALATYLE